MKTTRHTLLAAAVALAALAPLSPALADNPDWTKYDRSFDIAFPGYAGTETLTDFPVLVRLSKALNDFRYAACKVSGGGDLRFSAADGSLLPSEVEKWDPSGESLVWVKVPALAPRTTKITAHYGCASPDAVTATDVWDAHYLGVWHMGAAAGATAQTDSTGGGATLEPSSQNGDGVAAGASGVAGFAMQAHARDDGKGAYVFTDSADKFGGLSAATFEFWAWQDDHDPGTASTAEREILARASTSGTAWSLYENKSGNTFGSGLRGESANSYLSTSAATPPARAYWNHGALVYDGTDGSSRYYLNGDSIDPSGSNYKPANVTGSLTASYKTLAVGNLRADTDQAFPGSIDEVRISDIARSADWEKATHDSIRPGSGFASYEVANDWTKYKQRFSVTFSGYAGTETLTNFPVLVRLSENSPAGFRYADCLKPNGGDLRFCVSGSDAVLPCEVETWNTNGESLVWVKVPALTASTRLTAFYGWKLAPAVDSTQVWDAHYLGVWHLDAAEGETSQQDSTAGSATFNDSTTVAGGVAAGTNGVLGRAIASGVRSDGKGCYVFNDSAEKRFAGFEKFTIELWSQVDHDPGTISAERSILSHSYGTSWDWTLKEYKQGKMNLEFKLVAGSKTSTSYVTSSDNDTKLPKDQWNHSALVYDGSVGWRGSYMNGSLLTVYANDSARIGTVANAQTYLYLGNQNPNATSPFVGLIDEVRISDVARSADWIKATHDTIRPGSGFSSLSAAEENASAFVLIVR